MSESESSVGKLSRVVPNVFVRDVDLALAFYVDKLGFHLCYRHENDPNCDFGIVQLDRVEMQVTTCGCEDQRHVGQSFFTIEVSDAPSLYDRYRSAGVPMRWELVRQPWGRTDFTIIDPENNWISFTSDTEGDESE